MARGKYHEWLTPDGLLRLEAWARDDLTDEQIAKKCGISASTLYEWKKRYPEISEALKKGKEVTDIKAENALLKSGLGHTITEQVFERDQIGKDEAGLPLYDLVETRRTVKELPPNIAALIFWLKNRKPESWRDKPIDTAAATELLEKAKEMLDGVPSAF